MKPGDVGRVEDSSSKASTQQATNPHTSLEGEKSGVGGFREGRTDRYCLMLNAMTDFISSSFVSHRVFNTAKTSSELAISE